MSDYNSSDDDGEGWEEVCGGAEPSEDQVTCMFTTRTFPSAHSYFTHLKNERGFDIWNLVHVELGGLDFFGYVKLINYLRANYKGKESLPTGEELAASKPVWEGDEKYLKPVVEDDPLLQFIIDDDNDDDDQPYMTSQAAGGAGEEMMTTSRQVQRCVTLEAELDEMKRRMSEMKNVMQDIVMKQGGDIYRPVSACRRNPQQQEQEEEEFEDSGYFRSYDNLDIHREMLQDVTRTRAYRDAMLNNPELFEGKTVLDVGCGTGILSMFAARAGASKVYAVERSDIASSAVDNIRANDLHHKIQVIHGCVEEIDLGGDKVDVVISEWMGYFLLYESMLDSVLHAAKKHMKDDGVMLPNNCKIAICGADSKKLWHKCVGYWDDVYGFRMPCMKKDATKEAAVISLPRDHVISDHCDVFTLEINKDTKQGELEFASDFSMRFIKDGECNMLVAHFDVGFNLPQQSSVLTTAPTTPGSEAETHWKQTVFFLPQPVLVKRGDVIKGEVRCRKNPVDPRALLIDVTFGGTRHSYHIS